MSVLLVSDFPLVGDMEKFVKDHGYVSYYGPVGRSEMTQELLADLPEIDILWLEVFDLPDEIVLEKYENSEYGERKMWIVKSLGIASIPDDLLLHVLLPMIDLETLGTLSRFSTRMFNLVFQRVYNMSKELGEIKREEFRHLATESKGDLEAAYNIWSLYNRIIGTDRESLDILRQGCDLEIYEKKISEVRNEICQLEDHISRLPIPWLKRIFDIYFTVVDRFRCDSKCQRALVSWVLEYLTERNIVLIWEAMGSSEMELEYPQNLEGIDPEIGALIQQLFEFIPFGLRGIFLSAIIRKQQPELLKKITYEDYEIAMHRYLTDPTF